MKKILLLLTTLVGLSQAAWATGQDRGGYDELAGAEERIRFLLEGNLLKKAMITYLETIQLDKIDITSTDGSRVQKAFLKMLDQKKITQDIMTEGNYELQSPCLDSGSNTVPASTIIGNLGGKICFDITRLALDYKDLSGEQTMINLASVALHEHMHHFQSLITPLDQNEAEAFAVSTYVTLSAKVAQEPVLKWTDGSIAVGMPNPSVCERSRPVRFELEKLTTKFCEEITSDDLLKFNNFLVLKNSASGALKDGDLNGLAELRFLNIQDFEKIPGNLLKDVQKLEEFSADSSDYESYIKDRFGNAGCLNTKLNIPQNFFSGLIYLKFIVFKNPSNISNDHFKGVYSLKNLQLCVSESELKANFLSGLNNLESLELYGPIKNKNLDESFFKNAQNLKYLTADLSNLSITSDKIFSNLSLSNLEIVLPDYISQLPKLNVQGGNLKLFFSDGNNKNLDDNFFNGSILITKNLQINNIKNININSFFSDPRRYLTSDSICIDGAYTEIPLEIFRKSDVSTAKFVTLQSKDLTEKNKKYLQETYPNIHFRFSEFCKIVN